MTDTKFTPGPWAISKEDCRIIKRDFSSIGSEGGYLIGSTMGRDDSGFYADDAEADANAHLIAAAPELYEALEQAVTSMQDSGYPNTSVVVRAARAALAKARGES